MRKRVMMVIPTLSPGGAEKMVISIAEKIDTKKIELIIVVLYPYQETIYAKEAANKQLKIIYLNKKQGIDLSIILQLKRIIKKFKPDIIHTHLYSAAYVLFASPRSIPKYHTVHNVAQKEATGMRRLLMQIAYKVGNFTPVAISPYCAQTIEKTYHVKKIPCICNGIDTEYYRPNKIEHEGIKIINVGRLQSQKNHSLLISVFAEIHSKYPNTTLEIVGEGELRAQLEKDINKLNLSDCVTMQGISDDIRNKLNKADIYVMTSKFEGLPISVLEAMACGLPIVSTKAGGVIDIIEQGSNGFVVEQEDEVGLIEAISKLIVDSELRKSMEEKSREMALKFDINICAKKYQLLYFKELV